MKNVIISECDIMYCIAGQLYSQAPNRAPRKAEIILSKVRDIFRKNAENYNEFYSIEIKFKKEIIFDYIKEILMSINEFEELNLSQIEFENNISLNDKNRAKFNFVSMYDKCDAESWKNDFIDLDAFISEDNTNRYMVGLHNGLELAISLLENRKPNFKIIHGVECNDIFHTGIESIKNNNIEKDSDISFNETENLFKKSMDDIRPSMEEILNNLKSR